MTRTNQQFYEKATTFTAIFEKAQSLTNQKQMYEGNQQSLKRTIKLLKGERGSKIASPGTMKLISSRSQILTRFSKSSSETLSETRRIFRKSRNRNNVQRSSEIRNCKDFELDNGQRPACWDPEELTER